MLECALRLLCFRDIAAGGELQAEAHPLRNIGCQPLEIFLVLVRRPKQRPTIVAIVPPDVADSTAKIALQPWREQLLFDSGASLSERRVGNWILRLARRSIFQVAGCSIPTGLAPRSVATKSGASFRTTLNDSELGTNVTSASLNGGLGFSFSTTLNDYSGTSVGASQRQTVVFTAAHRVFSNT